MRAAALCKSWRRPFPIPPNGSLTPFLFQTRTILDHPNSTDAPKPRVSRTRAHYAASRLANYGNGVMESLKVEPPEPEAKKTKTPSKKVSKPNRYNGYKDGATTEDGRSKPKSERSGKSAKPRKAIEQGDDVPFEGTNTNDLERPYKSTITREEKEAFARLFNMVLTDTGVFQRKTPREGKMAQSGVDPLDGETVEPKQVAIQDEDFPEHFPGPLKRMAAEASRKVQEKEEEARLARELEAQAVDKIAREKAEAERLASDPLYQQQVAQKDRIEALLAAANTDVELWNVLETELFSPIQLLDLDQKTADLRLMASGNPKRAKKKSTEHAMINSHREDHVAIITYIYPIILRTALDHLIQNFPASTLPFSILPRIKRLGRTSYILGASTPLYNEIIDLTAKNYADFHRIDELLQEFDPAGLEFNEETQKILESIERMGRRGMQGRDGVNQKLIWSMDVTSAGWRKVIEWIPAVRERLEQQAVRVAEENARKNADMYEDQV